MVKFMKFTFFKRKKEAEQVRMRLSLLEQEKDELIQKISAIRLSKDEKIASLAEELTRLNKFHEEQVDLYEQRIKSHESIEESQSNINKMLEDRNKKIQDENDVLKEKNFELRLMIPSMFPVNEIMGSCADGAWYGKKAKRVFESVDGKIKLFFDGTVYEPCYEEFTAGCCVYYQESDMDKKKSLYTIDSRNVAAYRNETVTSGSVDAVKQYLLKKNVGFREI